MSTKHNRYLNAGPKYASAGLNLGLTLARRYTAKTLPGPTWLLPDTA